MKINNFGIKLLKKIGISVGVLAFFYGCCIHWDGCLSDESSRISKNKLYCFPPRQSETLFSLLTQNKKKNI